MTGGWARPVGGRLVGLANAHAVNRGVEACEPAFGLVADGLLVVQVLVGTGGTLLRTRQYRGLRPPSQVVVQPCDMAGLCLIEPGCAWRKRAAGLAGKLRGLLLSEFPAYCPPRCE